MENPSFTTGLYSTVKHLVAESLHTCVQFRAIALTKCVAGHTASLLTALIAALIADWMNDGLLVNNWCPERSHQAVASVPGELCLVCPPPPSRIPPPPWRVDTLRVILARVVVQDCELWRLLSFGRFFSYQMAAYWSSQLTGFFQVLMTIRKKLVGLWCGSNCSYSNKPLFSYCKLSCSLKAIEELAHWPRPCDSMYPECSGRLFKVSR